MKEVYRPRFAVFQLISHVAKKKKRPAAEQATH